MRHITDGELHAYLDGALDHLPNGRGDEVRRHLEECPVCRERLRDEEEILHQATGLLEQAAPLDVSAPSFEELRARAEASETSDAGKEGPMRHRRRPFRGMPLAWAATVVLALGVGWMGGQVWMAVPATGPGPLNSSEALLRPPPLLDSIGTEVLLRSGFPAEGADAASAPGAGGQTAAAGEAEALQEQAVVPPALESRDAAEGLASRGAAAGAAAEPAGVSEKTTAADAEAFRVRRDALAPIPSEGILERRSQALPEEEIERGLTWDPTNAEENSLLVPGLAVLSVEWEEWTPGERALYIRQLLPMGDTLELRYLGLLMGSDPTLLDTPMTEGRGREETLERSISPKVMEASLPPGWNQVVMRWRRGWLVARAPLPAESLRGILRSLK